MCRDLVEQGRSFAQPGIWDHRMMRWALSVPMIIIQKLYDSSPASYYIWPILSSTLTAIFMHLIGTRLISRMAGIFSAVIIILLPEMVSQGSQILATGTAAMFIMIAIYCLLRWKESLKWIWLIVASTLVFCSYGAKVTSVFFLPGIIISLLYYSYKGKWNFQIFKPVTIFMITFLLLFVAECLIFQKITSTPGGRAACLLKGRHGSVEKRIESLDEKGDTSWRGRAKTLPEYLLYFAAYHKYLPQRNAFLLNFGFLLAALLILLKNKRLYMLAFIFIPAYLMFTYAVLGAYPFMRMERINNRYYTACYAISILTSVCTMISLNSKFSFKNPGNLPKKYGTVVNFGFMACLIFMFFFIDPPSLRSSSNLNIKITQNNYEKIEQARNGMYPILMKATDNQQKDWKYIKRYRAFYGDSRFSFYERPKAVKLSDQQNRDSVYYVLESNQARKFDACLLSSITGNFVFQKFTQGK